ncbi:antileuko ase, partial [Paramuricea clavata]
MFLSAGKCPIPQIRPECPGLPSSLCSIDVECPGTQKCCDDGCLGFQCAEPLVEPTASRPKAGKCPTAPVKPECPPPVSLCSIDDECTGTQKCCDDGCSGSECREA